jgi:hypothetical protein
MTRANRGPRVLILQVKFYDPFLLCPASLSGIVGMRTAPVLQCACLGHVNLLRITVSWPCSLSPCHRKKNKAA